ncbi:MAG: transcription/translation regulatory transformer protein RfaH [Thiothrix sp.]|nr:transcription/translation regulatory transformer protein RfaH [Thiothrix sp.]HPQ94031.1 transcription/translation regulatory transformer protein RfaH [Thiolinea sp.]
MLPDSASERRWYLLTSKPHNDEVAEENLLNQDYEIYRPLAQRLRKHRGKMVKKTESLFPRYLFIHLDQLNNNWAPIRSTRGVQNFVRFGRENMPSPVLDLLVRTLQENERLLGERVIDLDRFHNGDQVLITEGPFKGLLGVFKNYDGEQRAIVMLEILHKQTRLGISPANLMAA